MGVQQSLDAHILFLLECNVMDSRRWPDSKIRAALEYLLKETAKQSNVILDGCAAHLNVTHPILAVEGSDVLDMVKHLCQPNYQHSPIETLCSLGLSAIKPPYNQPNEVDKTAINDSDNDPDDHADDKTDDHADNDADEESKDFRPMYLLLFSTLRS